MAEKPSSLVLSAILLYLLLTTIQIGYTFGLASEPSRASLSTIRPNAASISAPETLDPTRFGKIGFERVLISTNSTIPKRNALFSGNSTIRSGNRTFELGFFSVDGGSSWYMGIWYAAVTIRTYVWVANRNDPVLDIGSAVVELTEIGRLRIAGSGNRTVWETSNGERAVEVTLLESGNLVLLSAEGETVWQSFDSPADTWLPSMHVTCGRTTITSWRSSADPSPGNYALRLRPPQCGQFELVHTGTGRSYWSTGDWNGEAFADVPEMTVPYIYSFRFEKPNTPAASFVYTEKYPTAVYGQLPPLTRFAVDSSGLLKQFTWSPQTENWNMFWSRPENPCHVYGLCGKLGFCRGSAVGVNVGVQSLAPCKCLDGFRPENLSAWRYGDFSGGCRRADNSECSMDDGFVNVGPVAFEGDVFRLPVSGGIEQRFCEESCLKNCSCLGLNYNPKTGNCKNLYGNLLNLLNQTSKSTDQEDFYVRVEKGGLRKKKKPKNAVLIGATCGAAATVLAFLGLLGIWKRRKRRGNEEEEGIFPVTNLKVSDFGLAKLVGRDFSRVMTTMRGTWGYVAPEWISGVAITAKADVYSYGMTLLETLGGRRNVEAQWSGEGAERGGAQAGEDKWFFPPWAAKHIIEGNVANVVDPRLGGEYNQAEVERAALVAVWCIQDEEGARPTMGVVVKMLEGTVEVAIPPAPQLLQALVAGDSFPKGGIVSNSNHQSSWRSGVCSYDGMSEVGSLGSSVGRNLPQPS
ncbi:hypothetical protein MRB53_001282 [Persea americana]|uniref:Uncharacterized protein n=1 Tax=Persea americana TaxID=3435 RepID=A0ACC2MRD9_PERAE|nr:hypothetical protein MRB53_001282 [Persea americana]